MRLKSIAVLLLAQLPRRRCESCFVEGEQRYCLPSVLGVGTVGSGTTSLAHYLNAHPRLTYGTKKEHHFFRFRFVGDGRSSENGTTATLSTGREVSVDLRHSSNNGSSFFPERLAQRGSGTWRAFAREFPMRAGETHAFDFDPVSLGHGAFSRASLAAIVELYAATPRIVAVLRNPAVQHCRRSDAEACAAALAAADWPAARQRCPRPAVDNFHNYCYAEHVSEWHAAFGKARVHLIKSEELRAHKRRVLVDLLNAAFPDVLYDERIWPSEALLAQNLNVHNDARRDAATFQRCVHVHTRPASFLSDCNRRLVHLNDGDTRWLWWPSDDRHIAVGHDRDDAGTASCPSEGECPSKEGALHSVVRSP